MNNDYKKIYLCNNCGVYGHLYYNCRKPITSFGILCYRVTPENRYEYLLVQRKDSLGYVDFLRGKYSESNDYQLKNIISEITKKEKEDIMNYSYKELWNKLWNRVSETYEIKNEDKFNYIKNNKKHLFDELCIWNEPEWGFPKGRRDKKEKDLDTAIREFQEETGYSRDDIKLIKNLNSFEEIFTGSNLKSYKHKYFLAKINYEASIFDKNYQKSEIGEMKWFSYEECLDKIRPYNSEKIELLKNVQSLLDETLIF
jgi:ADP-ribose pyrophosphatase YjhB (NUDIX family)